MNLVEVDIYKCYLNLMGDANYSVNLKVGKNVSQLSNQKKCINGIIQFNEMISISAAKVNFLTNHKITLGIFMQKQGQQKKIIGVTNINIEYFSSTTIQIPRKKYKIDQSPDRNASIELSIKIQMVNQSPQKIRNGFKEIQQQNNSPNHRTASKQIMNTSRSIPSIYFQTPLQIDPVNFQKAMIQKQQQILKLKQQLKSFQNLTTLKNTLKKIQENNIFLKQVVSIEEKKNLASSNFINQILHLLEMDTKLISYNQTTNNLTGDQYFNNNIISQQFKSLQFQKFKLVRKQRDQLYQLSEELYNQVQTYKLKQKKLQQLVIQKQETCKELQQKIQILQIQINLLQNKKDNSIQSPQKKIKQLYDQNESLKLELKDFDSKFFQALKAIQQFKNEALRAKQQTIQKDELIKKLNRLQTNQSSYHNLSNNDYNIIPNFRILQQSIKQRSIIIEQINKIKQSSEKVSLSILSEIKNKISLSFINLIKGKITKDAIIKQKIQIIGIIQNEIANNNNKHKK